MSEDKRLVLLSELDILAGWDQSATRENSNELCQRSSALVTAANKSEDYTFLIKAWACWSFYNTVLPGGKKKWQITRIANPRTGELPPLAENWEEFGLRHLDMAKGTVSGYKSIWDTYVVKLHNELPRLSIAGKSKLLVAQKLIKDLLPGQNKELMDALFDPDVTLADLTEIVQRLREELDNKEDDDEDDPAPPVGKFKGDIRVDSENGTVHWTGWFILQGVKYELNEIVFDMIDDDCIGQGIPEQLVPAFTEALSKALK